MSDDFSFAHIETVDDVKQYLELMRRVFGENSRIDLQVKKWIDHHPSMTLEDFFVAKHHDTTVAGLCLIPSRWSIGGIELKIAELGCVATLPEYRHRGIQRQLMTEYHRLVTEGQYDLSTIEGIPCFYRQFGYEYAIPLDEQTRIALEKIPDCEPTCIIRPFGTHDLQRAMELLAQSQSKFYVHDVRDEGIWKMQQETSMTAEYEFEGYSVEKQGQVIAYFRISQNSKNKQLFLREITDVNQSAAASIMKFLRETGARRGLETLVCTISHSEPFARSLMETGLAEQPQPYAWQIRVTDYLSIFRKMKPLFEKRLESSVYNRLTAKINLSFYRYTLQFTIEKGGILNVQRLGETEDKAARFNPPVFTQLLLGYRSRTELERIYPDFIVRPNHKLLIDTLFPKQQSYIHTAY